MENNIRTLLYEFKMNKSDIIEKLKKLRALAEQGEGGEKINAQKLFEQLCKKYGINENELDAVKLVNHFAKIEGSFRLDLLRQIFFARYEKEGYKMYILEGKNVLPRKHRKSIEEAYNVKGFNVILFCTDADFIQIMFEYDAYSRSLDKRLDAFFYAFLSKNSLLVPAREGGQGPSEEERAKLREACMYEAFMEKTPVQKQLE